jgi:hypothetical protein
LCRKVQNQYSRTGFISQTNALWFMKYQQKQRLEKSSLIYNFLSTHTHIYMHIYFKQFVNAKPFYAPLSEDLEHIVFGLSVCSSVCLFVRQSVCKNFNIGHIFLMVSDRAFVFNMSVPCEKTFILASWPWFRRWWPPLEFSSYGAFVFHNASCYIVHKGYIHTK